jgi:hypothetical protein
MKTLSTQIGTIIGLGIDINLFFSMTVSEYEISFLGFYSNELEGKLISRGFEVYDYCYKNNPKWIELHKDGCRISLSKQ